jgi:cold shock CspA family protein/ribosome-associated translation inhibitor RaiA
MTLKPQVTFRNMEKVPELEAAAGKEAEGLDRFFDRITSCRVVIGQPRRQEAGGLYHVRVSLGVPGGELIVDRDPTQHNANRAIREAFREMRRQLQDYVHRLRGETKQHEGASLGTVTELSPEGGFGFLEADGRGVYFHRNSVLAGHFDRLRIGSRVRFADEVGEKGAQASSVRLVRPARQGRRSAALAVLPGARRGVVEQRQATENHRLRHSNREGAAS